jgi:hypothetical protein
MTQEDKLLKLLQVAVKNGWTPTCILQEYILEGYGSFEIENDSTVHNHASYEDYREFSLDQLVNQWEDGEVSFIGALCRTVMWSSFLDCDFIGREIESAKDYDNASIVWRLPYSTLNYQEQVRFIWGNTPSSKRLDELFKIFNHLLTN